MHLKKRKSVTLVHGDGIENGLEPLGIRVALEAVVSDTLEERNVIER